MNPNNSSDPNNQTAPQTFGIQDPQTDSFSVKSPFTQDVNQGVNMPLAENSTQPQSISAADPTTIMNEIQNPPPPVAAAPSVTNPYISEAQSVQQSEVPPMPVTPPNIPPAEIPSATPAPENKFSATNILLIISAVILILVLVYFIYDKMTAKPVVSNTVPSVTKTTDKVIPTDVPVTVDTPTPATASPSAEPIQASPSASPF